MKLLAFAFLVVLGLAGVIPIYAATYTFNGCTWDLSQPYWYERLNLPDPWTQKTIFTTGYGRMWLGNTVHDTYASVTATLYPRISISGLYVSPVCLPTQTYYTVGLVFANDYGISQYCPPIGCCPTAYIELEFGGYYYECAGHWARCYEDLVFESLGPVPITVLLCDGYCDIGNFNTGDEWKAITPATVVAHAHGSGSSSYSYTDAQVDVTFIWGPGGIVTAMTKASDPPLPYWPSPKVSRYWEIRTEITEPFLAEIALHYAAGEIPSGTNEPDMVAARYDSVFQRWEMVPTIIDADGHIAHVSGISGFSIFVLADGSSAGVETGRSNTWGSVKGLFK